MKLVTILGAMLLLNSLSSRADYPPAQPAQPAPTAPALVQAVTNDEHERLVGDANGKMLYVFDLDEGKATPACNGDCAEVWPPYLLNADEAKGLVAPLGSIVRANKKVQLTYLGRPVYTYAFDRVRGDDHGDGIGGVWHYIELK